MFFLIVLSCIRFRNLTTSFLKQVCRGNLNTKVPVSFIKSLKANFIG